MRITVEPPVDGCDVQVVEIQGPEMRGTQGNRIQILLDLVASVELVQPKHCPFDAAASCVLQEYWETMGKLHLPNGLLKIPVLSADSHVSLSERSS
jgi:hypothetical protein